MRQVFEEGTEADECLDKIPRRIMVAAHFFLCRLSLVVLLMSEIYDYFLCGLSLSSSRFLLCDTFFVIFCFIGGEVLAVMLWWLADAVNYIQECDVVMGGGWAITSCASWLWPGTVSKYFINRWGFTIICTVTDVSLVCFEVPPPVSICLQSNNHNMPQLVSNG